MPLLAGLCLARYQRHRIVGERALGLQAGRVASAREFHSRVSRVSRKQVKNGQLLLIAELIAETAQIPERKALSKQRAC